MSLIFTSPTSSRTLTCPISTSTGQEPGGLGLDQPGGGVAVGHRAHRRTTRPRRGSRRARPVPRSGPSPPASPAASPGPPSVETVVARPGRDLPAFLIGADPLPCPCRQGLSPTAASPMAGTSAGIRYRIELAKTRCRAQKYRSGPASKTQARASAALPPEPDRHAGQHGDDDDALATASDRRAEPLGVGPGAPEPPQLDDRQLQRPPGPLPGERQGPPGQLGVLVELVERPDVRLLEEPHVAGPRRGRVEPVVEARPRPEGRRDEPPVDPTRCGPTRGSSRRPGRAR